MAPSGSMWAAVPPPAPWGALGVGAAPTRARLASRSGSASRHSSSRAEAAAPGGDGGKAPLGVTAVAGQVAVHQGVEGSPVGLDQGALALEDLAEGLGLVEDPGAHGGNEGVAADKVHLEGEDAKEQVAVRR